MSTNYNFKTVGYSEIDKFAIKSYSAIHNISEDKNWGDITQIYPENLPDITFLAGGSPCQDFSIGGKKKGTLWSCKSCGNEYNPLTVDYTKRRLCPLCGSEDIEKTRSSLLVHLLEILQEKMPEVFFYENVKNLVSKTFKKTFDLFTNEIENYGYNVYYKVMNAKDYGIPQNRERVLVVAIRKDLDNHNFVFPGAISQGKTINDLLEDCSALFENTDQNILIDSTISPYIMPALRRDAEEIVRSDKNIFYMKCKSGFQDHSVGIRYSPTLRAMNSSTLVLQTHQTPTGEKFFIKRLTPKEAFRFMGFDDIDYAKAAAVVSKNQIYKQAGNSIAVNVVYAVLKNLFEAMPYLFENIKFGHFFSGIGAFEKAFEKIMAEINQIEMAQNQKAA
jgi:DNA-cytosine methyltransferase